MAGLHNFSAHIHLAFYFHFQNCNSHNIFFRTKIIPNAPWMSPCQTQLPLCIGGGFFAHPWTRFTIPRHSTVLVL